MSTTPTGPTTSDASSDASSAVAPLPAIPAPTSAADDRVTDAQSAAGDDATNDHRPADWPEQLRLPGQAAAPDGPIELSGMFLMHHAFRRDLGRFASAVARTPVGDRATWKALDKRWARFGKVLHKHHSVEDAGLWPLLVERVRIAGNEAAAATLEAMSEEHHEIDPVLVSCSAAFSRLVSSSDARIHEQLVADVAEFNDLLHAHLAHEETDALAVVQRYLTVEEWKAFEAEIGKDYKPWDIPFALCWVLEGLSDDARAVVFALPGAPPRRVWNLLRPGFDRRERRAFRYAD
jgi:hypothetical protein